MHHKWRFYYFTVTEVLLFVNNKLFVLINIFQFLVVRDIKQHLKELVIYTSFKSS